MLKNQNENLSIHIKTLRNPYVKPQVEIVPLLPKQTVLSGNCFTASSDGNQISCSSQIEVCLELP
jgi:hypothetical protein